MMSDDNSKRLCLVVPYFGKWPFWFDFFLTSCGWNPDIDWLFYTDCDIPDAHPTNVRFVSCRFTEYVQKVSDTLHIRFAPHDAYKLCDLKPALGAVHETDLQGYAYFGFGDIDVIWGDVAGWLYPRLQQHGCVSTHETRISGHLCAFHNTPELREAFRRAPDWQACLENPAHTRFDEAQFSKVFLRYKNWPRWARRLIDQGDPLRRDALFEESFSTPGCRIPWRDGREVYPGAWHCRPAQLSNDIDGDRVFPYVHFLAWKRLWREDTDPRASRVRVEPAVNQGWRLTAAGFDPLEQ